jgi:hypothetical protein
MNNAYIAMSAIATEAGDNFHFLSDCRALAQGRRNSVKFGRELSGEFNLTVEEAIESGLFGCRLCHKAMGVDIAIEADRKVARASRKAARAMAAEAKAKDAAAQAAVAIRIAKRDVTAEAADAANHALVEAEALRRRAALYMAIAAVYARVDTDKVRWDVATLRVAASSLA